MFLTVAGSDFYQTNELRDLGLRFIGRDVKISRRAVLYGSENISVGDYSRIDDFCILSAVDVGEIQIGKHVHIASGVHLYGGAGIILSDYVGLSSGCKVYSVSDDYSGEYLTNPTVPAEYRNFISKRITLSKHSLIGAGTILLPGAIVPEGTSVGAMSLVAKELEPWGIYVGVPARKIKNRSKRLLELENLLESETP
jgi:dTDP-4-amino-4,6-dideoxy-D-glucose acyltransferase